MLLRTAWIKGALTLASKKNPIKISCPRLFSTMTNDSEASKSSKKGYVFDFIQPTSPEFAQYPALAAPTIQAHSGKILAKQRIQDAIYKEDADEYEASFVMEFPSLQQALDWYHSKEYSEPRKLRMATSKGPWVFFGGRRLW